MKRETFLKYSTIIGGGIAINPFKMYNRMHSEQTRFIANYDTESQDCIDHLETITDIHIKYNVPATFFIVSNIINDTNKQRIINLLSDPLFEIASHSTSHSLVLPHPLNPDTGDARIEIIESKKRLEDEFGNEIFGYATPYAYDEGFTGHKPILELVDEAGYKYITTVGWGAGYTLPAPISNPFSYKEDGFRHIWEIPRHGWHENILKGHSSVDGIALLQWPSPWPESAIPKSPVKTPEEEFEVNKVFMDLAKNNNKKYFSPIWHPWSLGRFDKEMKMLDLTFQYLKSQGITATTFFDFYQTVSN
jgi:peptidoglycan/xylan/chitin deacetylase (PgdA/CDA1 family)